MLLFNGDVLEIERGQVLAGVGEDFVVELSDGTELHVPVPGYRLPPLKKISAGYYAPDPLDLIDLFIGSEGTLGLITEVTVDLVPLPAAQVTGLVFQEGLDGATDLGDSLRAAASPRRRKECTSTGTSQRRPNVGPLFGRPLASAGFWPPRGRRRFPSTVSRHPRDPRGVMRAKSSPWSLLSREALDHGVHGRRVAPENVDHRGTAIGGVAALLIRSAPPISSACSRIGGSAAGVERHSRSGSSG